MVSQEGFNAEMRPLGIPTVAITQRLNKKDNLSPMTGFCVNMAKTTLDKAPFPWAEPFYNAPARSCFRVIFLPVNNTSDLKVQSTWLRMTELTFLAHQHNKKEPMDSEFPEHGLYSPVALYADEDAANEAIKTLEELSGCKENLIAYGAWITQKKNWLELEKYPTKQAKAILLDKKTNQVGNGEFRDDLFGAKIV